MSKNLLNSIPLIHFLPNICTTMTLLFGFLSITSASFEQFDKACVCIVVAWIADCLDGRVARMTGSESDFGKEYDSLADLIAFGIAPAMLSYRWLLSDFHKLGWCLAFVYVAATALRLARFNIEKPGQSFTGLPCPAAAGLVVSYIWMMISWHQAPVNIYAVLTVVQMMLVSFLMVSHFDFKHLKYVNVGRQHRLPLALAIAVLISAVVFNPPLLLYSISFIYAVYGFLAGLWHKNVEQSNAKHNVD